MSPETSPQMFYISIVIERQSVHNHPWLKHRWRVVGVVVAEEKQSHQRVLLREDGENAWFMWQGFTLQLHRDQAPSYYTKIKSFIKFFCQNQNLQNFRIFRIKE
jgi:hypothetical protein